MTIMYMLTTFEKSVNEQAHSNDLKALEISLSMKKKRLKEAQIAVNCDSNYLERLSCCRFADYVELLMELTYIPIKDLLKLQSHACQPRSQVRGGSQNQCRLLVKGYKSFGTTNQTMPITFLLLLLGVGCGFAGKFCMDTLGASGNYWPFYWEFNCLVHFFANVFTSMLFIILYGPVTVTGGSMGHVLFPYWLRRLAFYAIVLVYLPLLCGLMPFAGPGEWLEHFSGLLVSGVDE
ncbi:hypothetical protein Tco_0793365 [Tanacetum coccineum]